MTASSPPPVRWASPLIAQEVNGVQTNLALVAAGAGISLLPASVRVLTRVVFRALAERRSRSRRRPCQKRIRHHNGTRMVRHAVAVTLMGSLPSSGQGPATTSVTTQARLSGAPASSAS